MQGELPLAAAALGDAVPHIQLSECGGQSKGASLGPRLLDALQSRCALACHAGVPELINVCHINTISDLLPSISGCRVRSSWFSTYATLFK